jgi:hypothetical protein
VTRLKHNAKAGHGTSRLGARLYPELLRRGLQAQPFLVFGLLAAGGRGLDVPEDTLPWAGAPRAQAAARVRHQAVRP